MTTTEPHPSLSIACPFCGAQPGQPCRTHRGRGHAVDHPHSRRIVEASPELQAIKAAAKIRRQALCCECGELRTVSKDYSLGPGDQNRGSGLFSDPRGWFATGTLKCSHCGTRTRHALLESSETLRDFAEEYQRYVVGGEWEGRWAPDRERLRAEYFEQFPRNPYLDHRYWVKEAKDAWAAGRSTVTALCGAPMTLTVEPGSPNTSTTTVDDDLIEPGEMRDQEYEDVETGLWWVDMNCVDCLRVSNAHKIKHQRKMLLTELLEVSNAVDQMSADDVAGLREHLGRIMDGR